MSTMRVEFNGVMGGGAPTYASRPSATENVTTSGTTAATTITAKLGDYARVTAVDAALYVATSQDASSAVGYYLASGEHIDLGPLQHGDTISGIEV